MRSAIEFLLLNLALIAMGLVGLGVVMGLVIVAKGLGGDDLVYWLFIPIVLAGIFSTYYAGKGVHHLLIRPKR